MPEKMSNDEFLEKYSPEKMSDDDFLKKYSSDKMSDDDFLKKYSPEPEIEEDAKSVINDDTQKREKSFMDWVSNK